MNPLCQRAHSSCGACCGLYNRDGHGEAEIRARLDARTDALAGVPRTRDAFREAARRLSATEPAPLFPSVRVCPLLGWLDPARTRVGCLAHPATTGGPDLRDEGVYDASICETFLCPSHSWLTEAEADEIDVVCADAHLYGLVVTDVPFVRAVLEAVGRLAGEKPGRTHLDRPEVRSALRRLFALKEELEPGSEGLFGAFRPGQDGEPVPRSIDYAALDRDASPWDAILLCVGADPRSGNDLDRLEGEVRERLEGAARALRG
ncbi:MAG: hypothetical protein WCK73_08235 [Deltaproteobacteria bacterium]